MKKELKTAIEHADKVLLMNTAICPVPGLYRMQLISASDFIEAATHAMTEHSDKTESHIGYPAVQQLFEKLCEAHGIAPWRPDLNRSGSTAAFEDAEMIVMLGCRLNYRMSDPKRKAAVGRQEPNLNDYEFFIVKWSK